MVLKDESQDADQPHKELHGVEGNNHVDPSIINGKRRTMEADRLRLDVAKNVGAHTSQCRYRQSLDRFIVYMDLMSK